MNIKNAKRNWRCNKEMLYFEAVAFINDLENVRETIDAKNSTFAEFLEVEFTKGTGKKALYQTVKIRELFLNHMKILSVKRANKTRSDIE